MNCSGTNDGVVSKIVANTGSINHAYVVGCYSVNGFSGNFGFLMYVKRFSSEYFNITDSSIEVMSSVYIKNANPAVVKFHANVGHTSTIIVCSYGTTCSSSYSYINLHNITLSTPKSSDWGGLIVARYASVEIDHCCCTSLILRAGQYLFKNSQGLLSLNNCFYDSDFITYGNITYLSVTRMDNLITYDCINSGVQS